MYPEVGFTKGQVIDYYTRVAPVLLPHLRGRPLTLKRYPDGVEGQYFYEKQCPSHRPDWVSTAPIPTGRKTIDFCLCERPAHARLAREPGRPRAAPVAVARRGDRAPDDDGVRPRPGPAGRHRGVLRGRACCCARRSTSLGLECFPKTSGSKGLQVYVPLNRGEATYDDTKPLAQALARHLEAQHPKLIVSTQKKELRKGKVLIDWSQNDEHKTTVCVYSLRARERPTVSTPVRWEELDDPAALIFDVRRGARAGRARRRPVRAGARAPAEAAGAVAFGTMVDWSLARQVADLSAGADDPAAYDVDLAAVCAELEGPVREYTGLELAEPVPAPELVSRSEWASANLVSLADLLDPVAARLDDRLVVRRPARGRPASGRRGHGGGRGRARDGLRLAPGARASTRSRCWPATARRGCCSWRPTCARAVRDMGVERSAFERWICAHELTHVFQFQGVPWLREHMSSLVREYLESVEVRIDRGAAGGLPSLPNPRRLVETLPRGRPGRADPDARAALRDGAPPGGHGRDRGPLGARDGLARRAPDPGPRRRCAPRWTAAAAPARRRSGWSSGCWAWT